MDKDDEFEDRMMYKEGDLIIEYDAKAEKAKKKAAEDEVKRNGNTPSTEGQK